jgi:hypothetical protein
VTWGGLGVAAAGLAFTAIAIGYQVSSEVVVRCAARQADVGKCGAGGEFLALFPAPTKSLQATQQDPFQTDPNSGKLLIAPLGYSLMAAGGIMTAGSLFFSDRGEFPWIPLVAGVLVGSASYGISAALNGKTAFKH